MKRIITVLLAITMAFSLAACGGASSTAASAPAASDAAASSTNQTVEVDKNLLSVEVTLPASMLESSDANAETPEEYCTRMQSEDGIQSATLNVDGSVTLKMTKAKHQAMLDEMKKSIDESIADYTSGETYTSIKEVTYNDNVTEFVMKVDKAAYENSFDAFAGIGLGFVGMYYDLMDGNNDPHITISVVDAETGEEVGTSVFPDDYADMFNSADSSSGADSAAAH